MNPGAAETARASELLTLSVDEISARIRTLLAGVVGGSDVRVQNVRRTFGGNTRRAWSFDAAWTNGMPGSPLPGILMSQVERAQADADLALEFGLLQGLSTAGVRAPGAIALDVSGDVIGAPSMLLERCPGDANAVRFLRAEDPGPSTALTRQLAQVGARLHVFDWRTAGLGEQLGDQGLGPVDMARHQVEHWHAAFLEARMEPHPVLSATYQWLLGNLPEPTTLSIVHGDFRPGNFLYDDDRITALLDWELAHLGDPVEDVAWAYRDFWSPARFVSIEEFVREYERNGGPAIAAAHLRYYRVFTEAKFATISLRTARAFREGRTTNLRLADRAATVTASLIRCLQWIEESEKESADAAADRR